MVGILLVRILHLLCRICDSEIGVAMTPYEKAKARADALLIALLASCMFVIVVGYEIIIDIPDRWVWTALAVLWISTMNHWRKF